MPHTSFDVREWLSQKRYGDTALAVQRAFPDPKAFGAYQRLESAARYLDPSADVRSFVDALVELADDIERDFGKAEGVAAFIRNHVADLREKLTALEEGGGATPDQIASELRPKAVSSAVKKKLQSLQVPLSDDGERLADAIGFIAHAQFNEGESRRGRKEGLYPRIDDADAKVEVRQAAGKYADLSWAHCQTFNNQAILAVLDTELIPLEREAKEPSLFLPPELKSYVERGGWKIRWGLLAFEFLIAGAVAYWLFSQEWDALGWLVVAYLAWVTWRWAWGNRKATKAVGEVVGKMQGLASGLRRIRDEVQTASYSPERLRERLVGLEADGCDVPSIVYRLLDLEGARVSTGMSQSQHSAEALSAGSKS